MSQSKKTLKKSLVATLLGLSALAFTGPVSFADAKCGCEKGCAEHCAKGEHKNCKCKTCECGKGKKCSHGQCDHEAAKEGAEAKPAAEPAKK